jgi:hypothetical protein
MNINLHEQLNKLRIISKLREGQSLYTKENITVYEFSYLNWAWRKWYNDNKEEVVRYLQEFYRSVDQSVEMLILDIIRTTDETKRNKLLHVSVNLAEKIKHSIIGVENLSKTYAAFPKITAMLEGIIQDFAAVTYKQLVEIIPKSMHTRDLSSNMTYCNSILYKCSSELNTQSTPPTQHTPTPQPTIQQHTPTPQSTIQQHTEQPMLDFDE